MSENNQRELLFLNPKKLFESKQYKKVLHQTVQKFVKKQNLDQTAYELIIQYLKKELYAGFLDRIRKNFDESYHSPIHLFGRIVFSYCSQIEASGQLVTSAKTLKIP